MKSIYYVSGNNLTFEELEEVITSGKKIALSEESISKIENCRNYLADRLAASGEAFYGINTGFGSLCNIQISDSELQKLQENLVVSHACGTGDEVPEEIVRIMLLLKIRNLSFGHSGIQRQTIERLIEFYNRDILPVVYQQGSLGASGDLAPLAHLSLPLLGLGEVNFGGKRMTAKDALKKVGVSPITLKSKEGLALLNGTQFSTAYGVWVLMRARKLSALSDIIASMSIDAFDCSLSPFNEHIHRIRPHAGQKVTAKVILATLAGSLISSSDKVNVQDPYAFRCVPQVHGASKDAIDYVVKVITTEINSVTDNPIIVPDEDLILSGGNFHAQPIALALDFLAIALSEIGSISERRTFQLVSGKRGLPAFLTPNPGLNSGLMIPQYTAASVASQNKQLSTPASIDSIVSSNGQEDHVSMAANAATKVYKIVLNLERLLAIELMTAAQALEFRRPKTSSAIVEKLMSDYRKIVPPLKDDRVLSIDIHKTIDFIRQISLSF